MKRTDPQSIRQIIDYVVRETDATDSFLAMKACAQWRDVVGDGVNRLTSRRYVDDHGVMHVYIESATVKNDLTFYRSRIIEHLNSLAGKRIITDLVIH